LVGGFIATYWSWRWIFFINIPIGIIGIAATLLYIPNIRETDTGPLDVRRTVLAALTLVGLVFGTENLGHSNLSSAVVWAILGFTAIAAGGYALHARVFPRPALDFRLFRTRTFAVSTLAGVLYRMGTGAVPFLLPMMLQVAFGMSAIQSGSLTFISAIGSFVMKAMAPKLLRRFGFRDLLVCNAVLNGLLLASYGLFRPSTPHLLILGLLLLGGFLRSIQFFGLNTLTFVDISRPASSYASTLSSVIQQISSSLGIASGAAIVGAATALSGAVVPTAEQFMPAFFSVGAVEIVSSLMIRQLPANAGEAVSGHRPANAKAAG